MSSIIFIHTVLDITLLERHPARKNNPGMPPASYYLLDDKIVKSPLAFLSFDGLI